MTMVCDESRLGPLSNAGPCGGPLLRMMNSGHKVFRCERHARMIRAWVETPHPAGQTFMEFMATLTMETGPEFEERANKIDIMKRWEMATS